MQKQCVHCGTQFTIPEDDLETYKRIAVPEPKWCITCRHMRRHAFINDYVFFSRTCDHCQNSLISIYPPHDDYIVYCQTCWYSDDRDDKEAGRSYDENRPFFEQFDELLHATPRLGIIGQNNQNCNYCESTANCKNCYLISECSNCEDCYYSYWIQRSRDCYDCNYIDECERCYEVENCTNCTRLRYSRDCANCHDSAFLDNCSQCSNCLLCTNLRQKKFCIFNEQFSEEEYRQRLKDLRPGRRSTVQDLRNRFAEFCLSQPRRWLQMENSENCTGNYVRNAKNCRGVFHCSDAEDCKYGEHIWRGAKDCMDANSVGRDAELGYETTNSGIGSYNLKFCRYCWGCRESEYCDQCKQGYKLFGCANLKPGSHHCILNKQYAEDEWEMLVQKIKAQMKERGEYGEFFPISISPFGYNTTISFDSHPLSQADVLSKGWKWENKPIGTKGKGTLDMAEIADDIGDIQPSICDQILTCEETGDNFKIIAQELNFYREEHIPLPRICPARRLRNRLALRPPLHVCQRPCDKCGTTMPTSYAPEYPGKVYCEQCYFSEIY